MESRLWPACSELLDKHVCLLKKRAGQNAFIPQKTTLEKLAYKCCMSWSLAYSTCVMACLQPHWKRFGLGMSPWTQKACISLKKVSGWRLTFHAMTLSAHHGQEWTYKQLWPPVSWHLALKMEAWGGWKSRKKLVTFSFCRSKFHSVVLRHDLICMSERRGQYDNGDCRRQRRYARVLAAWKVFSYTWVHDAQDVLDL